MCACGQTSNDELKREEQRDGSLLDAEDRDDAGPSQALSDAGSGDAQVDDASGPDGGGPPARMPAPPPDSVPRTFDPPIPGSFAGSVRGQIRARLMEPGPLYPPLPPTLPPGGREALCALRDKVLELPEDPFGTLGLAELGRNYYCDGGCFMCCLVPQNGSCHTSFDYDDDGDPPVNCSPGVYGAGTTIVGEALIYGDPLGLGICVGGVQQTCSHFPVCSEASAPSARVASDGAGFEPLALTASKPPHPDMLAEGAAGSRAKAYVKNLLHAFTLEARKQNSHAWPAAYVDLVTLRGFRNFRAFMQSAEPFSGSFEIFRREGAQGELLSEESYGLGILHWVQLALLGSVPHALERLAHVESRYWTDEEKTAYLAGRDPEVELRKTMGPLAFQILTQLPLTDYRLLAVPAPNEEAWPVRTYHGVELGRAPLVSAAQDCDDDGAVRIAVGIEDPYASEESVPYPVTVQWGDGSFSSHLYAPGMSSLALTHRYAAAGHHLVYVTASNRTGLRGVAGLVVHSATDGDAEPPTLARVTLDDVQAYGPALSGAGNLSLEVSAELPSGQLRLLGWSAEHALPLAGPVSMGAVTGHNVTMAQVTAITVKPKHTSPIRHDSVYIQLPSITLGFYDPAVGALTTRTLPLASLALEVFFEGASQAVSADLLERDINGRLILPVDREVPGLPADFCGATPCRKVDRIVIPITPELLGQRPASGAFVPPGLPAGSVARWLEDVPDTFVPVSDRQPSELPSACSGTLSFVPVEGEAKAESSYLRALHVQGPASVGEDDVQLEAWAMRSDGSMLNVTDQVTWSSADERVLKIDNGAHKGLLSAGAIVGTSQVVAVLGDQRATFDVTNERAERGYASYRIQFLAVHGAAGRAGINGVELIADDEVLQNLMTSETEGTVGPYAAQVQASSGASAAYAFDASLGTGWTSASGSFDSSEPYEVSGDPVYLQVDFEHRVPLNGVRIHRQAGILSASFAPQFPKVIEILGSLDGTTFESLATHTVENWDYAPVRVAF